MSLVITQRHWNELRKHGEDTYPHECCGVLLGEIRDDGEHTIHAVLRCQNTRIDSPHNRYHIDPGELVRIQREAAANGHDIIGFYHSHPDGAPMWSITDLAEAHWTGCAYLITNVERGQAGQTRSFVLEGQESDKRFDEEAISLLDNQGQAGA